MVPCSLLLPRVVPPRVASPWRWCGPFVVPAGYVGGCAQPPITEMLGTNGGVKLDLLPLIIAPAYLLASHTHCRPRTSSCSNLASPQTRALLFFFPFSASILLDFCSCLFSCLFCLFLIFFISDWSLNYRGLHCRWLTRLPIHLPSTVCSFTLPSTYLRTTTNKLPAATSSYTISTEETPYKRLACFPRIINRSLTSAAQ